MKDQNQILFEQAKKIIAGGVNSPVRSFKSVGGNPLFIKSAKGSQITDSNGKTYIDYVGSWGPMILGHGDDTVIAAVQNQAKHGLSFGAPTELETVLAKLIQTQINYIEKIRFVNSGTEATMSAIRLARGYTKRDLVVKFTGCYHGHSDCLLSQAGSGVLTLGKINTKPSSAGVPEDVVKNTKVLEYNNTEELKNYFKKMGNQTACVIIEPIAANMNLIPATPEFIQTLRSLCEEYRAVLIFDEVMSGFRVHPSGASGIYNITPDLITLGKVIGGGMPVGAFGGKAAIMNRLAPDGDVYQAGTLSGNPISMAAGIATLTKVAEKGFFEKIKRKTELLIQGMNDIAKQTQTPFYAISVGSLFGLFFTEKFNLKQPITRFSELASCDTHKFNRFFHTMLDYGIYLAPSSYEAGFVSSAHSQKDIEQTLKMAKKAMEHIKTK